jgi:hypothetical protein
MRAARESYDIAMRAAILLLLACGPSIFGETAALDKLRALLVPMRRHVREHVKTRGATPQLTVAKHQLRDWIESRLTSLTQTGEEAVLASQLNGEIKQAGLTCSDPPEPGEVPCPEQNIIGYLGDIKLVRSGEFLVVETAVGILCGEDESAYIYEWKENRWKRLWQSEQNDYTEKAYLPQYLQSVLISPTNFQDGADKTEHLVVTMGVYPWCTSNWQPVYSRVWLIKAGAPAKLLLDENEIGYVSEPIRAAAWSDDVLIEYATGSVDGGVHSRRQIRHYILKRGALQRVDPFVLGPRDFVDHWLEGPSKEVSDDTPTTVRTAVENWRHKFAGPYEFLEPTRHCTARPDLWQVGLVDANNARPVGYFLVRWRPPYRFSMVGVSESPSPDCTEDDPAADEFRTLFPDADHH